MTLKNLDKAPFPYFGGKRNAAELVWGALGDVEHYVEPFAGSLAVLLCRPHEANRTYHSETVNDADGLLVNAWRSIQLSPDATADAASNPVAEADLHARHYALVRWREEHQLEHLMGDPHWHDPVMGGWWIWGMSCWIGGGFASGVGPWAADESGRLVKRGAPGISRRRPHLIGDGQGVNRPQAREPGISRQLPHLGNNGQGVNHAGAREAGLGEPHPVTMPEVRRWFGFLSARLRHVRILNGDWARAVTGGASLTIGCRMDRGTCGVFLDPPYAESTGRDMDLYARDSGTVAHDVRRWALGHGDDPRYRIVLAGFTGEHDALVGSGWREVEWYKSGFLRGGMGNTSKSGASQAHRDRLWLSPHCLAVAADERPSGPREVDESEPPPERQAAWTWA